MMIQLTNDRREKFYLNAELIEKIIPSSRNTSEILLTTGRWTSCIESNEDVIKLLEKETECEL